MNWDKFHKIKAVIGLVASLITIVVGLPVIAAYAGGASASVSVWLSDMSNVGIIVWQYQWLFAIVLPAVSLILSVMTKGRAGFKDKGRVLALGAMLSLIYKLVDWIPVEATIPFPNLPIRLHPFLQVVEGMWFIALVFAFFSEFDYFGVHVQRLLRAFEKGFLFVYPAEGVYIVSYAALAMNVPFFMDNFQPFFLAGIFGLYFGYTRGWWIATLQAYHRTAIGIIWFVRERLRRLTRISSKDSNQGL